MMLSGRSMTVGEMCMTADHQKNSVPFMEATPSVALVDERVSIQARGYAARQEVTLRASMPAEGPREWEASATFTADQNGAIEPALQAPLAGTYDGCDAMGLFWSMQRLRHAEHRSSLEPPGLAPMTITLTAEAHDQPLVSTTLHRLFMAADVTRTVVREADLVGTLFHPAGRGPHPAILVLGGSDGGVTEEPAALLASHGYVTLALAYFGVAPLPAQFVQIPLDYIGMAITWLHAHPGVSGDRIAVWGGSKGAELALLAAATFPQIRAVVGWMPSAVVSQGLAEGEPLSSWTYRGAPLPFAPFLVTDTEWQTMLASPPLSLRTLYESMWRDPAAVERATIHVEQITGPVFLVSGTDDQMWPSSTFAALVIDRLRQHQRPYRSAHVHYPGAGHGIMFPYLPTTTSTEMSDGVLSYAKGGTPALNAHAGSHAWSAMLAFLAESLQP